MSRIPLADLEQQPEYLREWAARRGNLNVFRLLANAPNVFAGWTQMIDELFASPTFTRRMREVVILRELEEMSYRDIAAATGAPIGTVMSRLARGRALLREKLIGRPA